MNNNPALSALFQPLAEGRFPRISRVTSDGGPLLVRELDERMGLSELIAEHLTDSRGKNTQLQTEPLPKSRFSCWDQSVGVLSSRSKFEARETAI